MKEKNKNQIRNTTKVERAKFLYSGYLFSIFAGGTDIDILRCLHNHLKNIELISPHLSEKANAITLDILKDIAKEQGIELPDEILIHALTPQQLKKNNGITEATFLPLKTWKQIYLKQKQVKFL